MLNAESIFEITRILCWETNITATEMVKARDVDHALRIANRLFRNVVSAKFACKI
jgi:hypothetical protein